MLICPSVGHTVIEKNAAISNVEFVQTDRSYSYIVLALNEAFFLSNERYYLVNDIFQRLSTVLYFPC